MKEKYMYESLKNIGEEKAIEEGYQNELDQIMYTLDYNEETKTKSINIWLYKGCIDLKHITEIKLNENER